MDVFISMGDIKYNLENRKTFIKLEKDTKYENLFNQSQPKR